MLVEDVATGEREWAITVTNTFKPEPDTAARQPGVVAARPGFTG